MKNIYVGSEKGAVRCPKCGRSVGYRLNHTYPNGDRSATVVCAGGGANTNCPAVFQVVKPARR